MDKLNEIVFEYRTNKVRKEDSPSIIGTDFLSSLDNFEKNK
jgi:hypothetical protein